MISKSKKMDKKIRFFNIMATVFAFLAGVAFTIQNFDIKILLIILCLILTFVFMNDGGDN